jgi:hypothetical protein
MTRVHVAFKSELGFLISVALSFSSNIDFSL